MENVKNWLDKKGYYNSGLRTDRNHRIDLYLSDVLEEYRTELLRIHNVVGRSEQLVLFADWLQYNGKWQLPEEQVKSFLKEQKQN
jgi:hypothetical protein